MTTTRLANRPDIRLGDIEVRPSTCEVIGVSERVSLEPRVMEVLVTLIDAGGAVLSRDALIEACWDGRAVSEDAITRVISRIRRLSEGVAAGRFSVETLPKIGYRLLVDGAPRAGDAAASAPTPGRVGLAPMLLGGLVAAAVVAAAGWWALLPARPPAVAGPARETPADLVAKDLEMRGRAAVFEGTPSQLGRGIGYLRQATVQKPNDPAAWGSLAMAQVLSLRAATPPERAATALRIREAASRALALDPHEGLALAAQVSLEPTFGAWLPKDQALARAEGLAPPNTPAVLFQRAQFLVAVGRTQEAAATMERAATAAPLLPWIQAARVQALVDNQRIDEAERVAGQAYGLWPRDAQLWLARYWMKITAGRAAEALGMAQDRAGWPDGAAARDMALAADLARDLGDPSGPGADALLAAYGRRLAAGDATVEEPALRAAVALERGEVALQFAERVMRRPASADAIAAGVGPFRPGERTVSPLLIAPARGLWSQPKFADLMDRSGLVRFWQARGGPDLCADPNADGFCRARGLKGVPVSGAKAR